MSGLTRRFVYRADQTTASNGLTESSENIKLGGALTESTTITGAAGVYALQFNDLALFRIKGQDIIGSDMPFWVNGSRTGLTYGTADGETLGRVLRLQDNSLSRYFDMGFDSNGLTYFTKTHTGQTGQNVDFFAALRIDSSGRFAIGNNTATPLTTPTAYLHLAAGTAAVNTGPFKFTITGSALLSSAEAGTLEVDSTRIYYTPSTTRKTLAFTDAETFTGGMTLATGNFEFTSGLMRGGNGLLTAPTYSFTSEPGLGFYRTSAGHVGFATGGSLIWFSNGSGISVSQGANIDFAGTGGRIGSVASIQFAFWGATPVVQPTAVANAAGGATIDAEARTAINNLLSRMRTIGIIAT